MSGHRGTLGARAEAFSEPRRLSAAARVFRSAVELSAPDDACRAAARRSPLPRRAADSGTAARQTYGRATSGAQGAATGQELGSGAEPAAAAREAQSAGAVAARAGAPLRADGKPQAQGARQKESARILGTPADRAAARAAHRSGRSAGLRCLGRVQRRACD